MKKQIVVTGAGSGMGRAICETLSRDETVSLLLVGRRRAALEETRALLGVPERHRILSLDIADLKRDSRALVDAVIDGEIYALIANAGVGGENHAGPADRWDEIIETNLGGTYHFVQACLPKLKESRHSWRHIVVVSSILARYGVPKYSAYCASKAGLLGLTRSFAAEFAADRILVNAICPGWVETQMAKDGLDLMARHSGATYEEQRRAAMAQVPLGKMSKPAEIAAAVQFLVNADQVSITGQAIDVNNGAWMG